MGSEMFYKVQYGKESTRGTAVAATKRWLGTANIPKDREIAHPAYSLGRRVRSHQSEIRQILADPVTLDMPDGYFQGLPLVYGITLKGGVTPTEQTTDQNDFLWDFSPSLTVKADPDTATLEVGDDDQNYEIEYLMGRKVKMDFTLGDNSAVKFSTEAFGRQVSKSTATAGILPLPVTGIEANSAALWIDSTWATLGTTAKTGLLRGGSIEIDTGNHPKFFGNATKTFSTHGEGYLSLTGNFILEGGADAVAIYDAFAAGTAKAIRLKFSGPLIGSTLPHSLIYNMFVGIDEVIPLSGFANSNTLYAVTFSGLDDNQATPHTLGVQVVTDVDAY